MKRIQPLARNPVFTIGKQEIQLGKTNEYFNFFELKDTVFNSYNPLLVEFNFKVQSGDMPSFCWLVIGIDSAEGKTMYYRRIPLNWIKYNWLDMEKTTDMLLETGPLPHRIHRFVCYLWNSRHQQLMLAMSSIKVFQLGGLGADVEKKVQNELIR